MRILISCVGTRGDVQPAIALAIQARAIGHQVRLLVPPNFLDWAASLGFEAGRIGIEMRAPKPGEPVQPIPDLIADQFAAVNCAADGCDLIVGAGVHQYAARSVAEHHGIGCIQAVYAPPSIPSPELAPPGKASPADWVDYRAAWNERSLARVNTGREKLRLPPIDDSLGHILGDQAWLACDPVLGPAPASDLRILQTGAWLIDDDTPLPADLEAFLAAGDPPVYLGFGSMPARPDLGAVLVEAVRATGRRAILSQGWAGLETQAAADLITVGDVNHRALFPRVAAVVHHGGAGTTTTAARSGTPQVVAAMFTDQFYWGRRVTVLQLGATVHATTGLTAESLTRALAHALRPEIAERARLFAPHVIADGAAEAARLL